MTDVNIAVEMLGDAADDAFDTAILISAASDLVGPVRAVRERHGKRVVVAFPPERESRHLRREADAAFVIGDAVIHQSQLPERMPGPNGRVLSRPERWR